MNYKNLKLLEKLTLPLEVYYTRNKKLRLNLNQYRNAHFFILNGAKRAYDNLVGYGVKKFKPIDSRVLISYSFFPKRKSDVANFCCIQDKFFCDVLVLNGIILDDNCEIVKTLVYDFVDYDKKDPRIEVEIFEILA